MLFMPVYNDTFYQFGDLVNTSSS